MVSIQWLAPAAAGLPARFLWTVDGRIAMDPSCCCVPLRICGDCLVVPEYLHLVFSRFGPLPGGAPPAYVDCQDANGDFVLEFADPQPKSRFWDGDGSAGFIGGASPPCIYRYYFAEPTLLGMYGWGAELFLFSSTARIVLYPLDGDDNPWRYLPFPDRPFGEIYWYWQVGEPRVCHDFEATGNGGLGQEGVWVAFQVGFEVPDLECVTNHSGNIFLEDWTLIP